MLSYLLNDCWLIHLFVLFTGVIAVGKEPSVLNVKGIQDVFMAPVRNPGTASAMKAGVGSSVTRISTTAQITSLVRTMALASTLDKDRTLVPASRASVDPTVRKSLQFRLDVDLVFVKTALPAL